MPTNTARIHTGRLLEIYVGAGYRTASEVDLLFDEIDREIAKLPRSQLIVTCADWRYCAVMAPETSAQVATRIVRNNARVERAVAVLQPDSPTAVLQLARLIRESNLPHRRAFTNPHAAIDWLDEILTPAESARIRQFLNAKPHSSSANGAT